MELENQEEIVDEQATNQEEILEQPDKGTPEDKPDYFLNDEGGVECRTDDYGTDEPEPTAVDTSDVAEPEPVKATENPATETFKVKVDGEERDVTIEELAKGYMRQSDYTRKTQALAAERKQVQNPQYNPRQEQLGMVEDNRVVDNAPNLNQLAREIAARNLKLESVEDLSELDFDHITEVVEAKRALVARRDELNNRQNNIVNLENQLKSEDPAYADIMAEAKEKIDALPHKEYNKLQEAYNSGNPEPLRAFYKELQKQHYSAAITKNVVGKKTVPVVESVSNTPTARTTKKVDFRNIGNLSTEQKGQMLIDLGLLDD